MMVADEDVDAEEDVIEDRVFNAMDLVIKKNRPNKERYRYVDGKNIENKKYSYNDYQKFNRSQRKALYEMKKRTNNSTNNDENTSVNTTTIASLNSAL